MPDLRARVSHATNHEAGNDPRITALLTAVGRTPTASAMARLPSASAICAGVIMQTPYPQLVDCVKSTSGGLPSARDLVHQARMAKEEPQYPDIGARLEALRLAFGGITQREWAERHAFSITQYNNWEKGQRRIPVDEAEKLCELYGLTLDFVYRGKRDGLTEKASNALRLHLPM